MVPVALFLIFVLLYTTFGAVRPALLIYFNIPIAATGGVVALGAARHAVQHLGGRRVHRAVRRRRAERRGHGVVLRRAAPPGRVGPRCGRPGSREKLRPVLMTALVAGLGFVPMALSTGAGAEVQQPLATVVIGGLVTSTTLTLLVLPALYRWFERDEREVEL